MGAFAAATLFGWVTPILPQLLGPYSVIPMTPQQASWMISAPEFANLITPIPAAILADKVGRKPLILLSAPLFIIGWIIILYIRSFVSLLIARSFQGAAVGIVFTAVPVYLGEIASTESRGAISSLFFIFSWSGYLFEYCTGPFLSFTNFTLLTLSTNVVFFLAVLLSPESPYFYLMKGNQVGALKSLKWFRGLPEETVQQELEMMIKSVEDDRQKKSTWRDVIATSTDRKALYLMLFAGALRILSGTMPIVSYATNNFTITPDIPLPPEYITILLGLVLVLAACCSFFTLDLFGRRLMIISSSFGSSLSLLVIGLYYYLNSQTNWDVKTYSWVVPAATLVFAAIDVVGLYPVHTAYTSELFNTKTRTTAASFSAVISTFFTFLTLKLYQDFTDLFGVYFNFFVFSVICFLGAVVSYLYMPETKNKTFDEIRREL